MKCALLILSVIFLAGCASGPIWVSNPNDLNNVTIEKAIRKQLMKSSGRLTKKNLDMVDSLAISSSQLTSVRELGMLTELRFLDLYNNDLTDVNGLDGLVRLESLNLGANQLTNIGALSELTRLKSLILGENKLTSVGALENLTNFKIFKSETL